MDVPVTTCPLATTECSFYMRFTVYSRVGTATQYGTNYRAYPIYRTPELGQSKAPTSVTDSWNLCDSIS